MNARVESRKLKRAHKSSWVRLFVSPSRRLSGTFQDEIFTSLRFKFLNVHLLKCFSCSGKTKSVLIGMQQWEQVDFTNDFISIFLSTVLQRARRKIQKVSIRTSKIHVHVDVRIQSHDHIGKRHIFSTQLVSAWVQIFLLVMNFCRVFRRWSEFTFFWRFYSFVEVLVDFDKFWEFNLISVVFET